MSEPLPGAAGPPWWALLPPAQARVSCGDGTHRLRWDQGTLTALDHPDAEEELVLAALGGDRPACVSLIESWGRRGDDLQVLAAGPRSAADEVIIPGADDSVWLGVPGRGWMAHAPLRGGTFGWPGAPVPARGLRLRPMGRTVRMGMAGGARGTSGHVMLQARRRRVRGGADRAGERREELFSLLALGTAVQMRLSATVAAAWADGGGRAGERDRARPALTAALAGRLAPAAEAWLGIDPGRVDVSLHEVAGWGRLSSSDGRLDAALPVGWLASVWAPGLAVIAGHLVVAVTEAAWPGASVLAVPRPGAEPVILKVRAADGRWIRAEGGAMNVVPEVRQ
jgi:hypothetical protein